MHLQNPTQIISSSSNQRSRSTYLLNSLANHVISCQIYCIDLPASKVDFELFWEFITFTGGQFITIIMCLHDVIAVILKSLFVTYLLLSYSNVYGFESLETLNLGCSSSNRNDAEVVIVIVAVVYV